MRRWDFRKRQSIGLRQERLRKATTLVENHIVGNVGQRPHSSEESSDR
jgi:hypothetical protein